MKFLALIFITISIFQLTVNIRYSEQNSEYSVFIEKPFRIYSQKPENNILSSTMQTKSCGTGCANPVATQTTDKDLHYHITQLQSLSNFTNHASFSYLLFHREQTLLYLKAHPQIHMTKSGLNELQKNKVSFSLRMLDEKKQPVFSKTFGNIFLNHKQHHVAFSDKDGVKAEFNGTIKRVSHDRFWLRM
ncbi:hypothetical protein [Candidatus Uabimicrobium sp. HlEnr_7]|uniref:hypothetical protein n=1 Tax=Candidatus Uabimicrobium helgolandensis TaxID=3095367 RepID=UPI0035575833